MSKDVIVRLPRLALYCGVAAGALLAQPVLAQASDQPTSTPPSNSATSDGIPTDGVPSKTPMATTTATSPVPDGPVNVPGSEDGAREGDEIVVTGTSIRGVAPVGAPVLGLNQDQIQAQPATTTTELLRQIPSVVQTGAQEGFSGAANNANQNITGGSGINLRGLGTEATLTLLNGRRLPPAGTAGQFFDPSVIPTSAIGRVEVMADGGSAIYGSDAVGGVVNILLRRRFSGLETYVRQGFNQDVHSVIVGGVAGHSWGTGNVMISGEYQDRSPLRAADRSIYTDDLRPYGGTDQRSFNAAPGNIQIGSVRYPIPATQNGTGIQPGQLLPATTANPANRESQYLGADAFPGQKRTSVIGNIRQEITPAISLWSEGYYAHRRLDRTIGAATANLTVPSTNPFFVAPGGAVLPACAPSVGVAAGTRCETVNYSFSGDYGPRVQDAYQTSWQAAAGVEAELGGDWNFTAYGSYGRNDEARTNPGVNNPQLAVALRDTNPLTAFNPFGAGGNNPATLDRIRAFSTIGSRYDLWDASAKLDGTLFTLPGGPVKLAVGGEYQDHDYTLTQRNNTGTANTGIITQVPSGAKRNVKSAYAEVFVPVVSSDNAMPAIQELSVSAAVRYDKYSDFGSTTNPKVALRYMPVSGLTLRGSYGTSFRAPSLSDIDEQGLTITFSDFVSPTGQLRTLWVRGGNGQLGPENATIWSLGGDYKPEFINGLNLSLTYFNVDYKNRIENPGNDLLALSTASREALLGSLVVRNPSAELVNSFQNRPQYFDAREDPANVRVFLDGRRQNVGRLKTDGLEGTADYSFDLARGTVNLGVNATYLFSFDRAITPSAPLRQVLDTINNPLDFRARGTFGYTLDGFTANAFLNYADGYSNDAITPVQPVKSYTTVDFSIRQTVKATGYLGLDDVTFSLDVQNVFDKDPPIVLAGSLPFDPQVANVLGRFFTAGVRARW
jgi:iron complex outermembrane receptor protein